MRKGPLIRAILLLSVSAASSAQNTSLQVETNTGVPRFSAAVEAGPVVTIAVGERSEAYQTAYGGRLSALLAGRLLPFLSPRLDLTYSYVPVALESTVLTLVGGFAGVQLTGSIGERFRPGVYAVGGGYLGQVEGEAEASDAYFGYDVGVGATFQVARSFSIGIGASYRSFIGVYNGVTFELQGRMRIAGDGGGAVPLAAVTPVNRPAGPATGYIEFSDVQLDPVFPVLWKYYDSSPVGIATLTNAGSAPVTNVEVRLSPAAYIDRPKLSARIETLEPGETTTVDLYVLFNESILNVEEGAKIVADVAVTYQVGDALGSDTETLTLDSYDRNALRWDDDAKIAAFVTAKDDEVNRFARSIAGISEDVHADAVSRNMRLGMIVLEAMGEQRLAYIIDPSSAYAALSQNPSEIDFVQFPRQTLYVGGGDCDDLSSTYNALLESLGVSTAFVTTPGHIFAAFKLDMSEETARNAFADPDEIIVHDGSVWVPVETTLLREGFMRAWTTGASQWRNANADGTAALVPTSTAWETYQPVAFSVSDIELDLPDYAEVHSRFVNEFDRFVTRELAPREDRLLARLSGNPDDQRSLNRLGVLYAMYGRYDDARERFTTAQTVSTYVPAMLNLANLEFLLGNIDVALDAYRTGLDSSPQNRAALLGIARSEYELGNTTAAREAYIALAEVDPESAAAHSYLGTGAASRASSNDAEPGDLLWAEE